MECEVKWALGSIATNKASGGDGIPAKLFQILKQDAVNVLRSKKKKKKKEVLYSIWVSQMALVVKIPEGGDLRASLCPWPVPGWPCSATFSVGSGICSDSKQPASRSLRPRPDKGTLRAGSRLLNTEEKTY